jgi:hypothetical protein
MQAGAAAGSIYRLRTLSNRLQTTQKYTRTFSTQGTVTYLPYYLQITATYLPYYLQIKV